MKKYTFLLFFGMVTGGAFGQASLGFNGAGFFENLNSESKAMLHELGPLTIRIPGGAIAKYADPRVPRGWGLTPEGIDSVTALYGSDEEEATAQALDKWLRKEAAQPDYSYLEDVVSLQAEFPDMSFVWVLNMFIPAEDALYPVSWLLDNGVNLAALEYGNETYSQVKYNTEDYLDRVNAIREAMPVNAEGIPIFHPIAAGGLRDASSHRTWREFVNDEILPGEGGVFHPYYDAREFPSLSQSIDTEFAYLEIAAFNFYGQFTDMRASLPNAQYFAVTECNSQPAALIGDTELNAFLIERILDSGKELFDIFLLHNGIAADKYGVIYGTPPKRNSYFEVFASANNAPTQTPTRCDTIITLDTIGYEYVYGTINVTPAGSCDRCDRFFYRLFRAKYCNSCSGRKTPITVIVDSIPITTQVVTIDCNEETGSYGCYDPLTGEDVGYCRGGRNDDYLHPERFKNLETGELYCNRGVFIVDHSLGTEDPDKFYRVIIQEVYDSTGILIDNDSIDVIIGLPGTDKTLLLENVFNFCGPDGERDICNVNALIWDAWSEDLDECLSTPGACEFTIEMIDRETGLNIAWLFRQHEYTYLNMRGL